MDICSIDVKMGEDENFFFNFVTIHPKQHAKKVLSNSPGLVDFDIVVVNSVFNLPNGQVMFYEEFK